MVDQQSIPPAKIFRKKPPKRLSLWPVMALLTVVILVLGWQGLMVKHWDGFAARLVTGIIPVPAAEVDGSIIRYSQVLKRKDSLSWLQADTQAGGDTLFRSALDALVRQRIVEQIAQDLSIRVTNKQVSDLRKVYQGDLSQKAFESQVREALNLSLAKFDDSVLRPLALAQAVQQAIVQSTEQQVQKRAKIDMVAAALADGEGFSALAEQYSEDPSAPDGGDMGYFAPSALPIGWEALLRLPEGSVTPVIETDEAFVIAKVAWLADSETEPQLRVQAIIVKKVTLDDLVDSLRASSAIKIFVRFE